MSLATPRLPVLVPSSRRVAERLDARFRRLRGRLTRVQRDIALSGRLQLFLIGVVLAEQAVTLIAVSHDGAVATAATYVLVPTASALAALAVLVLVMPIRDLRREAMHDPLTGALNRVGFERRLEGGGRSGSRLRRRARRVLVALDLDGFKLVNDGFGHAAGDAVLREIVARLRAIAPRGALIGRLGGDEFALAIRLEDRMSATAVAEALRAALVARPIVVDGVAHRIGATAGVACREAGESIEAQMMRADLALVAGKLQGKNRTYAARPTATGIASGATPVERRSGDRRVT